MNKVSYPKPDDLVLFEGVEFYFADIFRVVDQFYKQVAVDPDLKYPFQNVKDWPEHIDHLTHFWWMRLGGKPYLDISYQPVQKHAMSGFNRDLLKVWLNLFYKTLNAQLNQHQTEIWIELARRIGGFLAAKNDIYSKGLVAR